jgi:hypothetical protein
MHVYLTINKVNGKKYIGYSTRNDDTYFGSGPLILAAIKKYGKHNFEKIILEECLSIEEVSKAERKWIELYDAVNSSEFYNLAEGGYGGNSETVKKYWSFLTEDERKSRNSYMKNIDKSGKNNPMYGKSTSKFVKEHWDSLTEEERKDRIKNMHGHDVSGSNNPMYGRSAVKEKNLKWYNNGETSIYVTEGTQPEGYVKGRGKMKPRKRKEGSVC